MATNNETERDAENIAWPQLAALARLPQNDWMKSLNKQIKINLSQEEGAPFKYAPIETNQIRLLFLNPCSSPNAVLEASMMVSNFPSVTLDGWHALSYTWGNAEELPGIIIIDGCKMKITENLELALRDVRNQHAIPYWVDAICINQADPDEKGHQIRHMRYIYEKANCVTVWLGRGNQQIEEAMNFLALFDSLDLNDESIIANLGRDEWSNNLLDGLVSLFNMPYWKRVWVLQEIACGRNVQVHCGNACVSWEILVRTQSLLMKSTRDLRQPLSSVPKLKAAADASDPLHTICTTRKVRVGVGRSGVAISGGAATGLWGLLKSTKSHHATDPRDKIFALLGLVEDLHWCTDLFPINYDVTVEQLYIDTARWIIVNSEKLNILCTPRPIQAPPSPYKLPSWCPDWTVSTDTNSLLTVSELRVTLPLGLWKPAIVSFGPEEQSMTAKGVLIDTYKTVMGPFRWELMYLYQFLVLGRDGRIGFESTYSIDQRQALLSWFKNVALRLPTLNGEGHTDSEEENVATFQEQRVRLIGLQDNVPWLRDEPSINTGLEMLWRTLVLDMTGEESERMQGFRSMFNCFCGWKDSSGLSPSLHDTGNELLNYTQPFRRRVAGCVHGRQVAITHKGHVGMIPVAARVDDIVCYLYGCLFPLVLRPQGSHYVVVGEAYIKDYMSLEATREMQQGKLEEKTFVIC